MSTYIYFINNLVNNVVLSICLLFYCPLLCFCAFHTLHRLSHLQVITHYASIHSYAQRIIVYTYSQTHIETHRWMCIPYYLKSLIVNARECSTSWSVNLKRACTFSLAEYKPYSTWMAIIITQIKNQFF